MLLDVSSNCYVCVLILVYMCHHTATYESSYCYMCPHTALYASSYMYVVILTICVSSYYMFVLILLCMCQVDSLARCSLWRVESAICVS